ncbi:universal stress protein [Actinoplanes teichomyceticus]|uniref:Nucleotide-binding universal stress UspA family protein n=1 Tax=Actinoplanes teichomyceticus TaxID=1867 RepID=A0A561WKC0_ACTTI|nr:universal stress protein [Actinoplanes teichomyceticus]TWG24280.1 nucleotide-binding universal stress UspA family protein [Actinoplanes teichomyceticus]
MTRTVVVAVDGADASRFAVRWAAAEARRREQPLRVVHVLDWEWATARYDFAGEQYRAAHQAAEAITAAAAEQARAVAPSLGVETGVLIGSPAAQLVIASETAGLMVLGHRGHGGFPGLRLGSVSQRVATHAHCSVTVVPDDAEHGDRPVAAGVDDSVAADGVLEAAFAAAHQRGVKLVAIRAYVPPLPPYDGDLPPAYLRAPVQDAAERIRLAEHLAPWQAKFPDVEVETLVSPDGAAAVLVDASRDAQLVIVGSRGHGVLAGTLLGSVGLQLLHHAACPVLIVRPEHGRDGTP